jgi:MraZ protein
MFRGISNLNIDIKGRIAMPSRYRDVIFADASGQLVVTIDHTDCCLLLYPMDQWVKIEQVLRSLPNYEAKCKKHTAFGLRSCL